VHDYERMYREACWHLEIPFESEPYNKFLESEEFKQLERKIEAEMYYAARNWLKMNDIEVP